MEREEIFLYSIIPGFRKSSKLLLIESEEQIYRLKYVRNDRKYYQCYNSSCKESVVVEMNSSKYCRKKKNSEEHKHGTQKETIMKLQLLNSIKRKCKTASLKRKGIRDIYDEECQKNKKCAHLLEFGSIRRQLSNIQQEEYPKAPICYEDIIKVFENENMLKRFGMSKYDTNKQFYVDTIIEEEFSYCLFASPTICDAIRDMNVSEPRNYIIDGTFNVIPMSKQFKQLLIFHIQHSDHAYPFIYVILSSKSEQSYTHVLQYIHTNVLNLNPKSVITDFETSLRNAIKRVYPETHMKGCWFHYTNALRRKATKIPNFIRRLNTNKEAKTLFKKFLILPLLKSRDIIEAFKILEEDAHSLKFGKDPFFDPFLNYFNRQWMKKERPESFSIYKEPITTSSSAESFHSQLRRKLPKKGNFYRFVNTLTDIDCTKSIDFAKSINGNTSLFKNKQKWYKTRMNFIHERLYQLQKNKITLRDILIQLSVKENCMFEENFLIELETDDDSDSDSGGDDDDDLEKLRKEDNTDTLCLICCEKDREVLCLPCKHCKICRECFQTIEKSSNDKGIKVLCPFCRAIVKDTMIIFM